jgi:hypothetical protein
MAPRGSGEPFTASIIFMRTNFAAERQECQMAPPLLRQASWDVSFPRFCSVTGLTGHDKIAAVHAASQQGHDLPFVHVVHHRKVRTRTAIK